MNNWFKNNPFIASLAAVSAVLLIAGGYFLFAEMGRLGEEQSSFDQKKMQLQRLQRNKPYPNQASVDATRKEAEEAAALLQQLAKELAVDAPPTTPQAFQDELAAMVKAVAEKAAARKIGLPENFYLGFEQYETQLPPADVVPRLSLQLRSINAVATLLLESQVKSLGAIVRSPVSGERGSVPAETEPDKGTRKKPESAAPELEMVPFDISFSSDQSAFRTAFNRVTELQPPVFVRLVAVENSSPLPPSKTGEPEVSESTTEQGAAQPSGIRPVVGRESLNVNMRLAGVVASKSPSP